ncbi:voltage-gated potassium channel protein [Acidihalobacter aeolianus]|nr:voltage-gated potassium channel protein [Acidihalobacter aeolianus]
MPDTKRLDERLQLGMWPRLRRSWSRLSQLTRADRWFPHVPLAMGVGLSGLLQLVPDLRHLLGLTLSVPDLGHLNEGFSTLAIHGIPQFAVGMLLLVMSLGLLWRSRLAWVTTMLVALAAVVVQLVASGWRYPLEAGYNLALLLALLAARRHFNRSSLATGTLFALTSVLLTLGYGVFGAYLLGTQFHPKITGAVDALYFAVVTMSTVGYGDIVPVTPEARLFVVSLIVLGLVIFATSLTAILGPLMNNRLIALIQPRRSRMDRSNHYIIVGDTALARNSFKELKARGQKLTLVLPRQVEEGVYPQADILVGEGSDLEVLRKAGAERAKAVLALGDDDSENAFVVLAVKEIGEGIRTVAAVSDARNLSRVKRVQPDLLLAPQVLGGELLAMALSGEAINSETLFNQLLHVR